MNETIKIINPLQMTKYLKHGVKPIDMFYDNTTEKVVYVYDKNETKEVYYKWINRTI